VTDDTEEQPTLPAVDAHEAEIERERKQREHWIERQQIEIVFSLGGGELDCAEWTYEDDEGVKRTEPYYYEGVPSYTVGDEFTREDEQSGRFRTIIHAGNPYSGLGAPPPGWRHVAFYSSSGEGDCPCYDMVQNGEDPATIYSDDGRCPLCENENDGEHHSVYLGDGWGERVVEQPIFGDLTEFEYEECHWLGSVVGGPCDRIELWRIEDLDDVVWVAKYSDEWCDEVRITERLIKAHTELPKVLTWIRDAMIRYNDLADKKERG